MLVRHIGASCFSNGTCFSLCLCCGLAISYGGRKCNTRLIIKSTWLPPTEVPMTDRVWLGDPPPGVLQYLVHVVLQIFVYLCWPIFCLQQKNCTIALGNKSLSIYFFLTSTLSMASSTAMVVPLYTTLASVSTPTCVYGTNIPRVFEGYSLICNDVAKWVAMLEKLLHK